MKAKRELSGPCPVRPRHRVDVRGNPRQDHTLTLIFLPRKVDALIRALLRMDLIHS